MFGGGILQIDQKTCILFVARCSSSPVRAPSIRCEQRRECVSTFGLTTPFRMLLLDHVRSAHLHVFRLDDEKRWTGFAPTTRHRHCIRRLHHRSRDDVTHAQCQQKHSCDEQPHCHSQHLQWNIIHYSIDFARQANNKALRSRRTYSCIIDLVYHPEIPSPTRTTCGCDVTHFQRIILTIYNVRMTSMKCAFLWLIRL